MAQAHEVYNKIVPRESASIPGRNATSIHANHMTKFSVQEDPGLKSLIGMVSRWVSVSDLTRDAKERPSSLIYFQALTISEQSYINLFDPRFLMMSIDTRTEGTCVWSIQTTEYRAWTGTHESMILWLLGYAGCGKTTLTNFLVECLQQSGPVDHRHDKAVYYWLCARDTEALSDARSLLRSIIVQILRSKQDVLRKVKRKFQMDRHELDHSFDLLWSIFQAALDSLPYNEIYIVIDDIDECEERSRSRLLDKIFHSLRGHAGNGARRTVVKYLIICQKTAYRPSWLAVTQIRHLYLEMELHQEFIYDLEKYLNTRVENMLADGLCSNESASIMKKRLGTLAETSFLWLRVVLGEIERGLKSRYRENDIEHLLEDTPQSLRDAYARYLPQVPSRDLLTLKHYLELLVVSTRPLTFCEIDAFTDLKHHPIGFAQRSDEMQAVKASLSKALGPLVRFSNTAASLIHSSAGDFLFSVGSNTSHPRHETHGVISEAAHGFSATACIRYLLDERVTRALLDTPSPDRNSFTSSPTVTHSRDIHPTADTDKDNCGASTARDSIDHAFDIVDVEFLQDEETLDDKYCEYVRLHLPAFDYAAVNWTFHNANCEQKFAKELEDDSITLLSLNTENSKKSYAYIARKARTDTPSAPKDIVLASFFNLPRIVEVLLERRKYLPGDPSLHHALYWAAFGGNTDCVRVLLSWHVPTQKSNSNKVPLAVAAQGGFSDVCVLLFHVEDVDPNESDNAGRPPLIIAARQNHVEILSALLHHQKVSWNAQDAAGRTALSEACRCGALESVQTLLQDGRLNVNAKDFQGRTALHHASITGNVIVLKHILEVSNVDLFATDVNGRNAISLAAENGHLAVVKRLYREGIGAGVKDKDGRNAISWAANRRKATERNGQPESVLEFLARKCPGYLDEPDRDGWSPLAWALDRPGYTEAVRMFLASGLIDVNKCDDNGSSILSWAAGEGFVDIVQLLLNSPGIENNSLNNSGRCPLSAAAANGMMAVVRILTADQEVEVSIRDKSGKCAIDWARLNGHWDIWNC